MCNKSEMCFLTPIQIPVVLYGVKFCNDAKYNRHLKKITGCKLFNTVEALISDHLGNSEKWSQLEPVAYENGLS